MHQEKFVINSSIALFQIASELKKVSQFYNQSNILLKLISNNPDYIKLLSNTRISKDNRKKILDKSFGQILQKDLLNYLKLLIDREKFKLILNVLKQLMKDIDASKNIYIGEVYSVTKLTSKQLQSIKIKISKKMNMNVELINKLDPTLIAGVKVKVNNKIFDGSMKNRLKNLQSTIGE